MACRLTPRATASPCCSSSLGPSWASPFSPSTFDRRWPFASCSGLKENVILGRLIPAGTGMAHYRNLEIEEGEYPEPTLNEFAGGEDFDDEYARLAQPVEELQGMTGIDGEGL